MVSLDEERMENLSNTEGNTLEDDDYVSQVQRYKEYIAELLSRIFRGEDIRLRLEKILFGKGYEYVVEPKYAAIHIAEKNINEYKKYPLKLLNSIDGLIPVIGGYDSNFAFKLNKIIKSADNKEAEPIIARIIQIAENYEPEVVYRYFRRYYNEFKAALSGLKDEGVREEIMKAIMEFLLKHKVKNTEMEVIDSFEKEVSMWRGAKSDADIRRYIERGAYYIRVLITYKDPVIDTSFDDPRIRQLMNYYKEIKLFNDIYGQIEKGEHENAWQDFEKFYKNVEATSDEVSKKFGDVKDAKVLLELKKKYHKSPEDWKREIMVVIRKLELRQGEIIAQAGMAFDKFFKEDIEKIIKSEVKILKGLRNRLLEVEKQKKGIVRKKARMLIKEVIIRKKELKSVIELKRDEIINEQEKKKDEEGKTFSWRREELKRQIASLTGDKSEGRYMDEIKTSSESVGEMVGPLHSAAKVIRSRNSIVQAVATAKSIGFIAGVQAAEGNMLGNAKILKDKWTKQCQEIILNGNHLLKRNGEIVSQLRIMVNEKKLKKVQDNPEEKNVGELQVNPEERRRLSG